MLPCLTFLYLVCLCAGLFTALIYFIIRFLKWSWRDDENKEK